MAQPGPVCANSLLRMMGNAVTSDAFPFPVPLVYFSFLLIFGCDCKFISLSVLTRPHSAAPTDLEFAM